MQDLKAELTQNLDEAEWEWLIPHVQRDAVILVPIELDLLNVGIAIASDNTPQVQQWIDEQLLAKPSVAQIGEWNGDRTKRFNTLIVQPYVLIQEK
ncbi:DUF2288 domain-containing protein [Hassallia byssoidea VB512170]|uniref:DUF2288 domain-containing protein n=1 Tax=Hassallia byssoidea VB512170 TaxID=1304833 RepID=A0A846HGW8_9CYAN|nr:DUF2288 domain-containing protein [Hassalia byssoidea]NEU76333.1 DUF2288 domain-containing protein [Hassalia byssoidea VB512170]